MPHVFYLILLCFYILECRLLVFHEDALVDSKWLDVLNCTTMFSGFMHEWCDINTQWGDGAGSVSILNHCFGPVVSHPCTQDAEERNSCIESNTCLLFNIGPPNSFIQKNFKHVVFFPCAPKITIYVGSHNDKGLFKFVRVNNMELGNRSECSCLPLWSITNHPSLKMIFW